MWLGRGWDSEQFVFSETTAGNGCVAKMALVRVCLALAAVQGVLAVETTLVSDLERLIELHGSGAITSSEFAAAKSRLLREDTATSAVEEADLVDLVSRVVMRHQQVFQRKILDSVRAMIDERLPGDHRGTDRGEIADSGGAREDIVTAEAVSDDGVVPKQRRLATTASNIEDANVWLQSADSSIVFGPRADVCLKRGGEETLGTNGNFVAEGELRARGGATATTVQIADETRPVKSCGFESKTCDLERVGAASAVSYVLRQGYACPTAYPYPGEDATACVNACYNCAECVKCGGAPSKSWCMRGGCAAYHANGGTENCAEQIAQGHGSVCAPASDPPSTAVRIENHSGTFHVPETDAYLRFGVDTATAAYSFSFWIKLTQHNHAHGNCLLQLLRSDGSQSYLTNYVGPHPTPWEINGVSVDDKKWHQITLTYYDGAQVWKSYEGGAHVKTQAKHVEALVTTMFVEIGTHSWIIDGTHYRGTRFVWEMDDFAMYAKALTAGEVATIIAGHPPKSPFSLDGTKLTKKNLENMLATTKKEATFCETSAGDSKCCTLPEGHYGASRDPRGVLNADGSAANPCPGNDSVNYISIPSSCTVKFMEHFGRGRPDETGKTWTLNGPGEFTSPDDFPTATISSATITCDTLPAHNVLVDAHIAAGRTLKGSAVMYDYYFGSDQLALDDHGIYSFNVGGMTTSDLKELIFQVQTKRSPPFSIGNHYIEVEAGVAHCGGGCHFASYHKRYWLNGYCDLFEIGSGLDQKTGAHSAGWSLGRIKDGHNGHNWDCGMLKVAHAPGGSYTYGSQWFVHIRSTKRLILLQVRSKGRYDNANVDRDCAATDCSRVCTHSGCGRSSKPFHSGQNCRVPASCVGYVDRYTSKP